MAAHCAVVLMPLDTVSRCHDPHIMSLSGVSASLFSRRTVLLAQPHSSHHSTSHYPCSCRTSRIPCMATNSRKVQEWHRGLGRDSRRRRLPGVWGTHHDFQASAPVTKPPMYSMFGACRIFCVHSMPSMPSVCIVMQHDVV